MKPTYRLAVAAALTLALSGAPALAQTYPDHTIKWVVPYQAGGGTDIVARSAAEKMSKSLGQSIVIPNKPVAATAIGPPSCRLAKADGHVPITRAHQGKA